MKYFCVILMCLKGTQCSAVRTLESYLMPVTERHISPLLHLSSEKISFLTFSVRADLHWREEWLEKKEQVQLEGSPLRRGLVRLVASGGESLPLKLSRRGSCRSLLPALPMKSSLLRTWKIKPNVYTALPQSKKALNLKANIKQRWSNHWKPMKIIFQWQHVSIVDLAKPG